MKTRWKRSLLVIVSLLLLVPCVAAVALGMAFDIDTNPQDPVATEQQRKEETRSRMEGEPRIREEIARKREVEMEMRAVRQAALIRLARINMDQAIQIATSQQPGKVMVCTLDAKGWEEPGKLSKDGIVFYRVVIADEATDAATHVFVNAIDGTILKTEKELPRKKREQ